MHRPETVEIRVDHSELRDRQDDTYRIDVGSLRQATELPDDLLAGFLLGRKQTHAMGSCDAELESGEPPALVYVQGAEEVFRELAKD